MIEDRISDLGFGIADFKTRTSQMTDDSKLIGKLEN
jgi:hypothetical protein